MLSYRHSYHAGNFADVLKHLVLLRILRHMVKKDKPLCYVDTHAGAGGYALDTAAAQQNREYANGIGKLWARDDLPAVVADYVELIRAFNGADTLQRYPGSPWIAAQLLRPNDRMNLFEAHPDDYSRLQKGFSRRAGVQVIHGDGYQGCIALLPPRERRGLVLIDPSYEVKTDYQTAIDTLQKAWRRFSTGVYALWYPVVHRYRIDRMERTIQASGLRRVQLFELGVRADQSGYGMTASGMLVVNPPWSLQAEMESVLPYLAGLLGDAGTGRYRALQLVGE